MKLDDADHETLSHASELERLPRDGGGHQRSPRRILARVV
jgi:hypothetical protein